MLSSPRIGQVVQIRYNRRIRGLMPLHGKHGVVIARSRGKPRNHLVSVEGGYHVIPCGNLFPVKTCSAAW